ncbi:DUF4344 domain-containing metallopeptidase [Pseudomonas capsici]|uniref:DUF4344 domain-containing metallopeptidase n=1 Tax=Pseudomonas capsici TaxID=2810614 RepID=UPI0013C2E2CC|nr:DUF4344 domain-containing metallopeptidase [Pseudomonas capsici]MCV4283390.1 DUF4344 domain-containing metallopeptidase [Pseudomonas capsici]
MPPHLLVPVLVGASPGSIAGKCRRAAIVATRLWKHQIKSMLHLLFISSMFAPFWPLSTFAASTPSAIPYTVQTADNIENLLNLDERKIIQEGLIWGGVYTGRIDGNFDKDTRKAIASLQQQYKQPGTGLLSDRMAQHLYQLARNARARSGWETLADPSTGVILAYPSRLLVAAFQDPGTLSMRLVSDDRKISLQMINANGLAPGAIDTLYKQVNEDGASTIIHTSRKDNMFITAGERGAVKFYSRYEQRGNEIRGYDLIWARDNDTEMQIFSPLISNSFEAFPTPAVTYDAVLKPHLIKQPYYPYLQALSRETRKQSASDKTSAVEQQAPAKATPDGLGPRFSYTYEELRNVGLVDSYRFTRKSDLLVGNNEIDALDGMFMTHRPLRYIARQCGMDTHYSPADSAVILCYGVVDYLLRQADALNANNDPAFRTEYVKARLRLALLHATGHALIDLLNLPPPSNEEETVDQLVATMILLDANNEETPEQLTHMLAMNATGLKADLSVPAPYIHGDLSKKHTWNEERYSNLLCMVYGSNPQGYASIVDKGLLPKSRAVSCTENAPGKYEAWKDFLSPHFAPRFSISLKSDGIER